MPNQPYPHLFDPNGRHRLEPTLLAPFVNRPCWNLYSSKNSGHARSPRLSNAAVRFKSFLPFCNASCVHVRPPSESSAPAYVFCGSPPSRKISLQPRHPTWLLSCSSRHQRPLTLPTLLFEGTKLLLGACALPSAAYSAYFIPSTHSSHPSQIHATGGVFSIHASRSHSFIAVHATLLPLIPPRPHSTLYLSLRVRCSLRSEDWSRMLLQTKPVYPLCPVVFYREDSPYPRYSEHMGRIDSKVGFTVSSLTTSTIA